MKNLPLILLLTVSAVTMGLPAPLARAGAAPAKSAASKRLKAESFTGLKLRAIGPALASGRIADIAVEPGRSRRYYVAVASGGVWKTMNGGTTWTPLFDAQGSYSIGCLALDPGNPRVIWVGTGENNSQRSVSYGDGVYKSTDGGKTWKNLGLKQSEHIGRIVIDPRDSGTVYVAAQGPLWRSGGDRGLYKTTDGGRTWKLVLKIDADTGVSDLVMDPRHPDVLYAAAYQRRRRPWTLIDGGPGSGLYRSRDAGKTWVRLSSGLPEVEMGRIGLAVAPSRPDTIYAIVEAAGEESGFYRSVDGGSNWKKMSDEKSSSPQYYQEIVVDPSDPDRVYSMDTWMMVTRDGGKTFHKVGERTKHVDNHALWIDPEDHDHLLAGCDGGLYESFDSAATWNYMANLPTLQFYRVALDNDLPFYNIYGGTQDNATLGGPSRTTDAVGIINQDWFVTVFGDGFGTQVDPVDPDVIYSQYQYGGLVRFDRRSGEMVDIQPQPDQGDEPLRWNWNAPLLLSPHSRTRLYFGANRLFQSDDRGDSWRPISDDLSRRIDRDRLPVMGRIQSVDAVARHVSTSFYGNLVAVSESPLREGLLYAGTDDGRIQMTADAGTSWRPVEPYHDVPRWAAVSDLEASLHDEATVYAAFDNHKNSDFKPYLFRSSDRGKHWRSISGDLPDRGSVYALAEDHLNRNLLFAGTEFGLFFTLDGGRHWIPLKGNLPVIAVRDLEIQRRENDLVVATFGRGFYILDDYSPLRNLTEDVLEKSALLFPVRRTLAYIPRQRLGLPGKAFQGDSFFIAPNPPFGAVFTYYLRNPLQSLKKQRQEKEKHLIKEGADLSLPGWEELRAEDREEDPVILLTVRDEDGSVVRRLEGPTSAGFHRVAWDLRLPPYEPTSLKKTDDGGPFDQPPEGPMVMPGAYSVSLASRVGGRLSQLGGSEKFDVVPLGLASFKAADPSALLAFQKKTGRLQRAVLGTVKAAREVRDRIDHIKKALLDTPGAPPRLAVRVREIEEHLRDLQVELSGDSTRTSRHAPTPPSIVDRVQRIISGHWSSTSAPTRTHLRNYEIAAARFENLLTRFRILVESDLANLEDEMETAGAPWTPGRLPRWSPR